MRTLRIALFALLAGCSSSQSMLQAPVYARCATIGAGACNELTDGVVLYADGDVDAARQKLWQAGTKTSPEKLKAFAAALIELGASPGAEIYAESMLQVSSLIEIQAARAAKAAPAPTSAASTSPSAAASVPPLGLPRAGSGGSPGAQPARPELRPALTADTDPTRLDGGIATPGASPAKVPCGPLHASGSSTSAYCVKAIEGPFVVTDLRTSPGCANDLFVAAGSSTSPRWALFSPSSAPFAVHGARLFVKEGEFLFVGAQAASAAKIGADARCSVLWSGFRPYTGKPGEQGQVTRDLGF